MRKVFHKILSGAMAFVVLCSTLSFTLNMHYCGNILVETAINHKAKSCGMESDNFQKEKSKTEGCSITKNNCCDDEVKHIEGQDELKLSLIDFNLNIPVEIAVFSFIYSFPESYTFKTDSAFNLYQPPEYACDFQTLHQVFLI